MDYFYYFETRLISDFPHKASPRSQSIPKHNRATSDDMHIRRRKVLPVRTALNRTHQRASCKATTVAKIQQKSKLFDTLLSLYPPNPPNPLNPYGGFGNRAVVRCSLLSCRAPRMRVVLSCFSSDHLGSRTLRSEKRQTRNHQQQ